MKKLLVEKIPRVTKSRRRLEKELEVKITNRGKEVFIEGEAENEYIAEKVIQALDFGFSYASSIEIKNEDFDFEILNIKEHTTRKDLEKVRGRIIGKAGKTLKTLSDLSDCHLEIKDNFVGIIGSPENLERATEAIALIARGAKQGNVYAGLEKNHPQPVDDLGLRKKEQ
jgi:ribosomal RNA assembly protein